MQRDIFTAVLHLLSGPRGTHYMTDGLAMANDGSEPQKDKDTVGTNSRQTYENFMSVTKWAVIGIAVVLILMAVLLA
jgi:hypothetical protein